jgi:nicotinate-nucleotide--dimethylbenzimidazole phosphoribosyltransferase
MGLEITLSMRLLNETIAAIRPIDVKAAAQARARLDSLTKPPGSLGDLELIVQRYAAIRRDPAAIFRRGAITVFVADHGIAAAGVSAYPKSVTVEMMRNIAAGGAAISVLTRTLGFDLTVTDVGVDTDSGRLPGVRYARIARGTQNFLEGPAMSMEQAQEAIKAGIETAASTVSQGATIIGLGEMGIANTTASSAVLCALTGMEPARLAGRGTGINDEVLDHKVHILERALERHRDNFGNSLGVLASVGGFEIGAMAGVCLGAAAASVPIVVDGFIATAAAALAIRICPTLFDYLFFGHRSAEVGHDLALKWLGAKPLLDLNMRLGEGTGAALAMSVIRSALAIFHEMATFDSAGVSGPVK